MSFGLTMHSSPILPSYARNTYTPQLSSPLAPRTNFTNNQLPPSPPSSPLFKSSPAPAPARRSFKPNPLKATREAAREQRRQLFLNKVRESRDEKRFKERGGEDEMLRLMYISEENRRLRMAEMEARRVAAGLGPELEEEVFGDELERELEDIEEMEQRELEEILEHLTGPEEAPSPPEQEMDEEDYGMDLDDVMMCDYAGEGNYACPCGPNGAFIDMQGECVCFNCGWTIQQNQQMDQMAS